MGMALDRGGGGGRGLAMGPLTARKIGARLEVGGLRFAEPLFEVYDAHDRRMNAVVGLRYDASDIGSDRASATEVLCYGTAVVIEPLAA